MVVARLIRRVHVVVGLAAGALVLLFAVSGLMLNHRWALWEFWSERVERVQQVRVEVPRVGSELERARSVLSQMKVQGEVTYLVHDSDSDTLEIRTTRPGRLATVRVHNASGEGRLTIVDLNGWSLLPGLHVLSGLHSNLAEKKNWIGTAVWSAMMDATVLALVLLVGTGLYLWAAAPADRRVGMLALAFGTGSAAAVLWVLCQ
ncbi:MAG: PepSY-associated TM helix domain-containing protein [Candidatus Latescibacterota bacterium]|jgi:hypothetical protein